MRGRMRSSQLSRSFLVELGRTPGNAASTPFRIFQRPGAPSASLGRKSPSVTHWGDGCRAASRAVPGRAQRFAPGSPSGYAERSADHRRSADGERRHSRRGLDQHVCDSRNSTVGPTVRRKAATSGTGPCYREMHTARRWVVFFLYSGLCRPGARSHPQGGRRNRGVWWSVTTSTPDSLEE